MSVPPDGCKCSPPYPVLPFPQTPRLEAEMCESILHMGWRDGWVGESTGSARGPEFGSQYPVCVCIPGARRRRSRRVAETLVSQVKNTPGNKAKSNRISHLMPFSGRCAHTSAHMNTHVLILLMSSDPEGKGLSLYIVKSS